ncbi:hypothetical protein [Pseudoclavibacter sp. VKM Ac-2888]|uniref:hypothetical protein n=1 Tax=Pseudoclavibacter sp. VKM Ac-2888 TaxID=2783830 RepID=UPI00188A82B9|nr:hypothetical protein [Pseudoclavibacter sp. VKM Ac-2888]MBF4549692.1 hypothetical protein [Pseudoclavibacter sp. VKM Ac-2888]
MVKVKTESPAEGGEVPVDALRAPQVLVTFEEDELLALAAALDGNRAPGMLGAGIDKVSRAALDVIHGSRASRRAVRKP